MCRRSSGLIRITPISAVLSVLAVGFLLAAEAQARPESLQWTHSRPSEVQRFEVRVSSAGGSSSQIINLGVPTPGSDGIYQADVEVGDGDVEVEMRAFGPGFVASAWSAPQTRLEPSGGGGGGGGSSTVPVGGGSTVPPIAGSAARFDFSSDPVGSSANGWFDTRASFSLVEDDSLFDVVQISGNRVLHTSSTDDSIHSHVRGSGNVWTNFVLHGRMAADHPDADFGVTSYSQYPSSDGYYRLARRAGGSFRLEGRPALSCSGADTGVVPAAGTWYRFELDVEDEGGRNRVRAKVWRAGDSEPAGFQVDCVDSAGNRPRQGTIGVYAGGDGQKYWDDLELVVATVVEATPPEPPILIQIVPAVP